MQNLHLDLDKQSFFDQEFSVSELSSQVKNLISSNFLQIRVRGEISGLKIADSGHGYFSLKENQAILSCVCWKNTLSKIKIPIKDGMQVVLHGSLTTYSGQSRYQISVGAIVLHGVGEMMQILQERKARLLAEGLFDKDKKKSLPFMPKQIAVITSLSGAVIKDIIHRIRDRCPTNILIYPATVQGETAATEMTQALHFLNNNNQSIKPDVIIIARGGGSVEDLWPFNDEELIREAYISDIPVISAVGHETDYTLLDFVSDLRAPTPTAAAEIISPDMKSLRHTITVYYKKLLNYTNQSINHNRFVLKRYEVIMQRCSRYIVEYTQKLDELYFRLNETISQILKIKSIQLSKSSMRSNQLFNICNYKKLQLHNLYTKIIQLIDQKLITYKYKLDISTSSLENINYKSILKRGFVMTKSTNGKLITSYQTAKTQEEIELVFLDGILKMYNKK
ncbi:MAG: exodeoxyribonuclease VII large subunit [Rickettsiaceae bacterium]